MIHQQTYHSTTTARTPGDGVATPVGDKTHAWPKKDRPTGLVSLVTRRSAEATEADDQMVPNRRMSRWRKKPRKQGERVFFFFVFFFFFFFGVFAVPLGKKPVCGFEAAPLSPRLFRLLGGIRCGVQPGGLCEQKKRTRPI